MCAERKTNSTDEIEITTAMIEAGVEEFCGFDSRFEDEADAVARVYRAMIAASRRAKANRKSLRRASQADSPTGKAHGPKRGLAGHSSS
jgi:hypothetical protein